MPFPKQKIPSRFPLRLVLSGGLILVQMGILGGLAVWGAFRSPAAFALCWGGGLLLALTVAVREENSSYKAAWILAILGLPPLGALLWLTWGWRYPTPKRKKALLRAKAEKTLFFLPEAGELAELSAREQDLGVQAAYLLGVSGSAGGNASGAAPGPAVHPAGILYPGPRGDVGQRSGDPPAKGPGGGGGPGYLG